MKRIIGGVAALALLLSSCGSSEEPAAAPPAIASSAASSSAPLSTAAAGSSAEPSPSQATIESSETTMSSKYSAADLCARLCAKIEDGVTNVLNDDCMTVEVCDSYVSLIETYLDTLEGLADDAEIAIEGDLDEAITSTRDDVADYKKVGCEGGRLTNECSGIADAASDSLEDVLRELQDAS